jgi:hypothetical protein
LMSSNTVTLSYRFVIFFIEIDADMVSSLSQC